METAPKTNPYGEGNGMYSFYVKSDLGAGNITVSVENKVEGTITGYHPTGVKCGEAFVNITRPAGSYNFKAVSQAGPTWTGTMVVSDGVCQSAELTINGSGGGSGGYTPPSDYEVQGTINVAYNSSYQLCLRDYSTIDGDVLDLLIDGKVYLSNYTLTGSDKCLSLNLSKGKHWIGIIPKNDGTINCCSPGITIGGKYFELCAYAGSTKAAYVINVQ